MYWTNCYCCSAPCRDWNMDDISSTLQYLNLCKECADRIYPNNDLEGNGFISGGHSDKSIEEIRQEKKEDKKLSTATCCVCGIPCNNWGGDSVLHYYACPHCAAEIHKNNVNGHSSYVNDYLYINGDGFPDSWKNIIDYTIKEYNKNKTAWKATSQNVARKVLAQKVISLLKDHMYPYGGYVRDHIAEEPFKDLDLFMPRHSEEYSNEDWSLSHSKIVLDNAELQLTLLPSSKQAYSSASGTKLTKLKYLVYDKKNGSSIEIDLVKSDATCEEQDHPYPSLDADINSLGLDRSGKPWAITDLNLEEVIKHIKNKEFEIPGASTLKGERVNKLLRKGYRVVNSEKINRATLKPGDRVTVAMDRYGSRLTGTILFSSKEKTVLAMDAPFISNSNSTQDLLEEEKMVADLYGLSKNQYNRWEIKDNITYTSIVEVSPSPYYADEKRLDRKLSWNDLYPGKHVECVYSSYSEYIGKTGHIKDITGIIKIVWDDGSIGNETFYNSNSFKSFYPEREKKKEEAEMNKIPISDLQEGDRVKLNIKDPSYDEDGENEIGDQIVEATFLYEDEDGNAVFYLDCEYSTDEFTSIYSDDLSQPEMARYIASKLKKDESVNHFWTAENSSYSETSVIEKLKNNNKDNKGKTMPNDQYGDPASFTQIVMQDAGKAAIRSGATLGINGLKAGIEKILAHEGVDSPGAQAVMKFFNGPVGEAMLRASLGYGLLYLPIPLIQENDYAQKLSEELRVSGMSKGMDKGAELLQEFIVPSLMMAFKDTPLLAGIMGDEKKEETANKPRVADVPQARVAEQLPPKRVATDEEHEMAIEPDPFKEPAKARA